MDITAMKEKSRWVWRETLKIHKFCPESRIASSLSCVEILVALYYGGVLNFDAKQPFSEDRDRLIISKGHGSISYYPILADLGFIAKKELDAPGSLDSKLKAIPDTLIEGYETINGSLGHGIGVGIGMALGLKAKGSERKVFVLVGDGELNEGSMWEAIMLAGHHKLDNLCVIVDKNNLCMLDYCRNIVDLEPIEAKFQAFGWDSVTVDGHDEQAVAETLTAFKTRKAGSRSLVVVAHTVKGRGVKSLEVDSLCHIKSLKPDAIDELLKADELSHAQTRLGEGA
ncbi:MAG: transketolase [Proteobacteria bacterium]|nr:transketolase [Pseudomonadota bacterium]